MLKSLSEVRKKHAKAVEITCQNMGFDHIVSQYPDDPYQQIHSLWETLASEDCPEAQAETYILVELNRWLTKSGK